MDTHLSHALHTVIGSPRLPHVSQKLRQTYVYANILKNGSTNCTIKRETKRKLFLPLLSKSKSRVQQYNHREQSFLPMLQVKSRNTQVRVKTLKRGYNGSRINSESCTQTATSWTTVLSHLVLTYKLHYHLTPKVSPLLWRRLHLGMSWRFYLSTKS